MNSSNLTVSPHHHCVITKATPPPKALQPSDTASAALRERPLQLGEGEKKGVVAAAKKASAKATAATAKATAATKPKAATTKPLGCSGKGVVLKSLGCKKYAAKTCKTTQFKAPLLYHRCTIPVPSLCHHCTIRKCLCRAIALIRRTGK